VLAREWYKEHMKEVQERKIQEVKEKAKEDEGLIRRERAI